MRLDRTENWQRWGTCLPERQWGTVREDYSGDGNSWAYLTYDKSGYQAYRWGEDGLLGWTDRECRLCYSTSLWNGQDSHLKERLFGLSNPEGNHGEDVKELYCYLDALPSHAYAKALYKYPQRVFPYDELRRVNADRGYGDSEYELLDTNIFDEERYFDVMVEYAKIGVDDTLIRLSITNRGPDRAPITVLPTLTLQNDWSWNGRATDEQDQPYIESRVEDTGSVRVHQIDPAFAKRQLLLLLREWYMHPNGQMASYEYAFSDVNPPVHAWAALEVYRVDAVHNNGMKDTDFLERVFQKLLLNLLGGSTVRMLTAATSSLVAF